METHLDVNNLRLQAFAVLSFLSNAIFMLCIRDQDAIKTR